ncbi:MAG: YraN family protein [Gammaproteobacteria bacterium]
MKAHHLIRGSHSEATACKWLRSKGLKLVTRNFSCPLGELDLIMLDQQCLVIVEVRYRRNSHFGGALESVSRGKQLRIARTTEIFLQARPEYARYPVRFDVVAVSGRNSNQPFDWRRNAFYFDHM